MEESLTAIAYKAGFKNLHDLAARFSHLMGSVMSDNFEILYFRHVDSDVEDLREIDIFAVVDPYEYDSCALYRLYESSLMESLGGKGNLNPGVGGLNIDKRAPLHTGPIAVDVLESYANQLEEVPPAYDYWNERKKDNQS
tara:strand:+ start:547 stop:966 length:420 start_codon:yes stop_codon:yes gene_type:complete